jgi:beta-N-acetylhexosaminidase
MGTQASVSSRVEDLLGRMTRAEKVGQMVMGMNAPGLADTERLIRDFHLGSVITFSYEGYGPTEAASRNNDLQALAARSRLGIPILNSGDFEQGLSSRMRGVTDFPQPMGIGASRDGDAAERCARITAEEGRATGFHWNYAPDADVNINSANPVIGVRTFGGDTDLVTEMVSRQVMGYQDGGMMACVKHFPGHGNTEVDSHLGLPVITDDWETFARVNLPPFRAAIERGVASIMTAHIIVRALDPDLPGTLSRRVLTGLLREELGYEGIIVTDAMSMAGVAEGWGVERAAVMTVQAGADIVMATGATEEGIRTARALLEAIEAGEIPEERLDVSVRRVLAAKERLGLFENAQVDVERAGEACATPEHIEFVESYAPRTVTLVKNDGVLPFPVASTGTILLAGVTNYNQFGGPDVTHVPAVADMLRQQAPGEVIEWAASSEDPSDEEIAQAVARAEHADRVVVLTFGRGRLASGQGNLVQALMRSGKPLVAIATGTPYDIASFPGVPGYIATSAINFGPTRVASPRLLEAAIRILFGQPPGGRLPVEIPGLYPLGHGLRYD